MNQNCLHCRLVATIMEWGAEFGDKGPDGTRLVSLEQGSTALTHCLGELLAATIPLEIPNAFDLRAAALDAAIGSIVDHMQYADEQPTRSAGQHMH